MNENKIVIRYAQGRERKEETRRETRMKDCNRKRGWWQFALDAKYVVPRHVITLEVLRSKRETGSGDD